MSYSDKLKDPRWQKKRLEVLSRDSFTCKLCGDSDTELHIHHVGYKGEPWEQDLDKLDTLCKHCHLSLRVCELPYDKISACSKKIQYLDCAILVFVSDELSIAEVICYESEDSIGLNGRYHYSFFKRVNDLINERLD